MIDFCALFFCFQCQTPSCQPASHTHGAADSESCNAIYGKPDLQRVTRYVAKDTEFITL